MAKFPSGQRQELREIERPRRSSEIENETSTSGNAYSEICSRVCLHRKLGMPTMTARGGSWRLLGRVVELWAMRGSAVHATWPRSMSRRSWSFSPINSVVPRSRSPLPQAGRDAERRTGEPGVALLAGVRGENSPHYTKRTPERKNANRKCRSWLHFRYSHDGLIQAPYML